MKQSISLLITGIFLLTGCGLVSRDVEQAPPLAPPPPRAVLRTAAVTRGTIAEVLEFSVTVRSNREETLFFPVAGRVREVSVRPGDAVEAGQILAALDADDLETRVHLARIDEEKAALRLRQASESQADPVELRLMELDLEKAKVQSESLSRQLERTRLRAPFRGRVETVAIEPGDQVQSYATAAVLIDPADLRITGVTGSSVAQLSPGLAVDLLFPQLGREPVRATLLSLPTVDRSGRSVPAVFVLEKADSRLQLGMRGTATVYLERRENVLLVPNAAIRRFAGGTFVQVLEGETRRDVSVRVGLAGPIESEIIAGLEEGQKVVIGQ
jgi:RND family efflux transporter MFP subunit